MIIVASGPSARGFVPPDDIPIIAVNGVIEWISRADYWFTLDPSPDNIMRMARPRDGVEYHAAVENETNIPDHVTRWRRVRGDWSGYPTIKDGPGYWLRRLSCRPGLSTNPCQISTGNSAYGAVGLAYHMGASKVALIGVDANEKPRVEGGVPRNLSHLPALFASALPYIGMVSCGGLNSVPQASIEDALIWLRQ